MLNDFFDPSRIKLNLESRTKDGVLEELVEVITGACSEYDEKELLEAVTMREGKKDTIISPGIAMPHGYCTAVNGVIGAIGFSRKGIEYAESDKTPVHLFLMLLMDESSPERNLRIFNQIMLMLKSTSISEISGMINSRELYDLLCRF